MKKRSGRGPGCLGTGVDPLGFGHEQHSIGVACRTRSLAGGVRADTKMVDETDGTNAAIAKKGREPQRGLVDVDRLFEHDAREAFPTSLMRWSSKPASLKLVHGVASSSDAGEVLSPGQSLRVCDPRRTESKLHASDAINREGRNCVKVVPQEARDARGKRRKRRRPRKTDRGKEKILIARVG
jgi:hypothetical protein